MKAYMIEKFAALITTAFGLVAALAWNEAIKGSLVRMHLDAYGPWAYALAVTLMAVFAMKWLGGIAERAKKAEEKANRAAKKKK